jgi:hypothetical protein
MTADIVVVGLSGLMSLWHLLALSIFCKLSKKWSWPDLCPLGVPLQILLRSYRAMDECFWDMEKQVHLILLEHPQGDINKVIKAGDLLCKAIGKYNNDGIISCFIDLNYDALIKVKHFLLRDKQTRSIHDRLYIKHLKFSNGARFYDFTRIFEMFIEGITYFKHQKNNPNKLVYHRLASCGDGSTSFRNMFNRCTNTSTSSANKRIVKKRIETCYIERLIYAEIYKEQTLFFPTSMTDKQDKGHENWLAQTHDDFKTCFPNTKLSVTVSDYLGKWPTKCTITREKNGKVSTEEYTKIVNIGEIKSYGRFVDCKLVSGSQTKYKVQSFEKADRWVRAGA